MCSSLEMGIENPQSAGRETFRGMYWFIHFEDLNGAIHDLAMEVEPPRTMVNINLVLIGGDVSIIEIEWNEMRLMRLI